MTKSHRRRLGRIGCFLLLAATAATAATVAGPAWAMDPFLAARLRGLDKITGRASDFVLNLNETTIFGGIDVTLRACWQSPPEDPPETSAYLEISSIHAGRERLFSGWMFASSPGLNALEHPIYDVWVTNCTASAPENWDGDWGKSAERDKPAESKR